ncbi:MAG: twin-arginine translocase TatA/TatE family subunit [Pseudomonadota bacterium]
MFGMGMPEILVILAVALIVIGPKKLPDLAKSLGRAINEFRHATTDLKESLIVDTAIKDVKTSFKDRHNKPSKSPDTVSDGEIIPTKVTMDVKTVNSATSPQESRESEKNA